MTSIRLVARCSECGDRIQRNGPRARWRHQRPNPNGSARNHKAAPPERNS